MKQRINASLLGVRVVLDTINNVALLPDELFDTTVTVASPN